MTDFSLLKLPSGRRVFLLLVAVLVISGMSAPMKGLPMLRNELGAFAGTACLLAFIAWWLKKEQLPLTQLFSEGRYATPINRLKNVLYFFPVYIAVFLLACYLIPVAISLVGKYMPAAALSIPDFERWLMNGKLIRNQRLESLLGLAPVWQIFWMIFCAPLIEELFFRRFLYVAVRKRFGFLLSLSVSSVLFGLIHAPIPISVISTVIAGIFIGVLYERSRDFGSVVLFHSLNNIFVLVVFWKLQ